MINVLIKWLVIAFLAGMVGRVLWRALRAERSERLQTLRHGLGRCCLTYLLMTILFILIEPLFIYHPYCQAIYWNPPNDGTIKDVWLTTAEGTRIHGWWRPVANPRWVVLYCHGSNGNISIRQGKVALKRWDELHSSVFLFDYPGYGRSDGWPSEPGCYASAQAAYDWLVNDQHVSPDQLVVCGRSLGGAMAVELAVTRPVKALVLHSAFTSVPDVAANIFPLFPARALTHTQFNNLAKIAHYDGPLFVAHGDVDTLVPFEEGERLFAAAPGDRKQFYRMAGRGHNGVMSREVFNAIDRFLVHSSDSTGAFLYDNLQRAGP